MSKVADRLHRSKAWVSKWHDRYKKLGVQGLYDYPRSGRPTILPASLEGKFIDRVQSGPTPADEVSAFRGRFIKKILNSEFNLSYSLSGVYDLLRRLDFKKIKPRPRHEKNDAKAMEQWKKHDLPIAVARTQVKHSDKTLEIWFQDEMRFGNKTRITSAWKKAGTKWNQRKQIGFKNRYIYGAVNPSTGQHVGLVFPDCSTEAMNIHLGLVSQALEEDKHALLIMDQAGWHSKSKGLVVPANITIFDLPPYSPELNPVERLWLWLKENYLSNITIPKNEDMVDLGCKVWNQLTNDVVKSVCHTGYLSFTNFS